MGLSEPYESVGGFVCVARINIKTSTPLPRTTILCLLEGNTGIARTTYKGLKKIGKGFSRLQIRH